MRKLLVVLAVLLSGCATTKPLEIACASCKLLNESGMCAQTIPQSKARPACPDGEWPVIVNYDAWSKAEAAPVVECRKAPR